MLYKQKKLSGDMVESYISAKWVYMYVLFGSTNMTISNNFAMTQLIHMGIYESKISFKVNFNNFKL